VADALALSVKSGIHGDAVGNAGLPAKRRGSLSTASHCLFPFRNLEPHAARAVALLKIHHDGLQRGNKVALQIIAVYGGKLTAKFARSTQEIVIATYL